jgi:ATP-dependent Clp protease ATP-binding subunit ClpA
MVQVIFFSADMLIIGKYTDHHGTRPIDCSKTIWIIATNLGDNAIFAHHDRLVLSDVWQSKDMDISKLEKELEQLYINRFQVCWPFLTISLTTPNTSY